MYNIQFEDVCSFKSLMESADRCGRDVKWKSSTQMFLINKPLWCMNIHNQLILQKYKPKLFTEFWIVERGKLRYIQATHISDRCVQKSLCQNALKPIIEPRLISDNPASREGMGTSYTLKRLRKHLAHHYRKYGDKGGILILDLHDYFHSIDQDILLSKYRPLIQDDRIYNLTEIFIRQFDKGLGLGSETCQISAIFYANNVDHFVKEQLHIEGYGRFMDDSYLISDDLNYLKYCLKVLTEKYHELGIELNPKKTKIVPFHSSHFEFMKKRIHFSETGKIIMRPTRDALNNRRRKLKKQKELLDKGQIQMNSIRQSYRSWRGQILVQCDCWKSVRNIDKLYFKLFNETYNGYNIYDIEFAKHLGR